MPRLTVPPEIANFAFFHNFEFPYVAGGPVGFQATLTAAVDIRWGMLITNSGFGATPDLGAPDPSFFIGSIKANNRELIAGQGLIPGSTFYENSTVNQPLPFFLAVGDKLVVSYTASAIVTFGLANLTGLPPIGGRP